MWTRRVIDRRVFGLAPGLGLAIVFISCAYLAAPYVTLYRLGRAMHRGDVASVLACVDWDSVRSGIAQDVAAAMTGAPAPAPPDALPAFGASFASGVASNAVDAQLTPATFAATFAENPQPSRPVEPGAAHLDWAFFAGPTRFVAALRTADGAHVRLRLDLIGLRWVLTRAWLPPEMLHRP